MSRKNVCKRCEKHQQFVLPRYETKVWHDYIVLVDHIVVSTFFVIVCYMFLHETENFADQMDSWNKQRNKILNDSAQNF